MDLVENLGICLVFGGLLTSTASSRYRVLHLVDRTCQYVGYRSREFLYRLLIYGDYRRSTRIRATVEIVDDLQCFLCVPGVGDMLRARIFGVGHSDVDAPFEVFTDDVGAHPTIFRCENGSVGTLPRRVLRPWIPPREGVGRGSR